MKNLKQLVVQEYSSPLAQKFYIEAAWAGLWGSEEILIKRYFKPKSKILDIGCGTGRTTIPLFKMGYDVVGIDITPMMIENAKKIAQSKNLKINYKVGNAINLKFENESFDNAIFSFNGWTQIPERENRQKALNEVWRILKFGGYYIFTAHAREMRGFAFFWIQQWIKLFILKPFGFRIDEIEFGDRFFTREGDGTRFQKQYIHIPSVKDVLRQIERAGLKLIYSGQGSQIYDKNQPEYPPMFYVCQK